MSSITPALPKGSLILVTGANGYIASHIVHQLLLLGYRVRGSIRNEKPWLRALFSKYGAENLETVVIGDMTREGAFDQAVQGVGGVIHVASDATLSLDPENVIKVARVGTLNILKAAAKTASVTRVVVTSSSTACNLPKGFEPDVKITEDTWNDEAVALAQDLPKDLPDTFKGYIVYSASKTISEREAWNFMREQKPDFILNTIIPSTNLGANLDPENIGGSTGAMIRNIYTKHDFETWRVLASQYHINVTDCALLHIAALLTPSVISERLFAYEQNYTQRDIIEVLERLKPGFKWPEAPQSEVRDRSQVPGKVRAEGLVRDFFGVKGWRSLEVSLRETFEGVF